MSNSKSSFLKAVGIDYPIVQGPMNGGSPAEMVAAVSNAGALGSFAAALHSPLSIIESVKRLRTMTDRPFNVNLFILSRPNPTEHELARSNELLAPIRQSLGLEPAQIPKKFSEDFREQVAALLEAAPPVVSFTFGLLDSETVSQFHKAGCLVIGTATTVAEGKAWESVGADFICAQGSEAGGHRATFIGDVEQSSIGLMALIPQLRAAVSLPIIAAGGITDGRGVAAALILGAQAAQLGTAFLACHESGIASVWRERLRTASDDSTRLTRTLSGRYARGIVNEFMERLRPFEREFPGYPVQNALTSEIRQAATKLGRPEFMSLWAGQAAAMTRPMPASQLVSTLVNELRDATAHPLLDSRTDA